MPFDEDLSVFFDPEDFADAAILNDSRRLFGIFDDEFLDALGMAASGPAFICPSAELLGAHQEDRLQICDTDYRIVAIEPDGTGVTVLRLVKT